MYIIIKNYSHNNKKTKEFEEGGALLPILSLLYTDFQLFTLRAPPLIKTHYYMFTSGEGCTLRYSFIFNILYP